MSKLERKIKEWKAGDRRAFDFIYEQTNRSVYFAALYIVKDKAYAEDIMQDTYLRAITAIDSYVQGTNFIGWLVQIAKNLALNHVKKAKREVFTDFEAEAYRFGSQETQLPYVFEMAANVLTEEEYYIIMLCHVAGYKRREVAQMTGLPIGTVTWKNNQAIAKLREYLQKEGEDEG